MKTTVIDSKLVNIDFIKSFKGKSQEEIIALKSELQNQVDMAELFISKFYVYTERYNAEQCSYNLKHQIENYFKVCGKVGIKFKNFTNEEYISNEALKIAMFYRYYEAKLECKESFNLIYKYKYTGPKFFNGLTWVEPHTEEDWEKIINVFE